MNRLEYRRSLGLPKSGLEESTEDHPWQPIDTAPKDGTPILGFIPSYYQGKGGMVVAVWMDFSDRPGWYSEISSVHEPTHWMPLPPAPTGNGADEAASREEQ